MAVDMAKPAGFWSVEERLSEISDSGDPLETLNAAVNFERFRPILERAAGCPGSRKGGRPALDVVLKFRMLVLQSLYGLSLDARERMVRDKLSWMRFCGLGITDTGPDANTLWDFRETLIEADALVALLRELERAINRAGFLPRADGSKPGDIAIPVFGDKSHISLDRQNGIIRRQIVTDAAQHDGAHLREGLIQTANTGRQVWADTAYRSAQNDAWLEAQGLKSEVHRKKPRGRPMSKRISKANARKSAVRAKIAHVFGHQKDRMGLVMRTIGLARARATITRANMTDNMCRLRWLLSRTAPA